MALKGNAMEQSQGGKRHLEAFGVLVGTWEMESPQFPGFRGRTVFEWMEDGSFLVQRSTVPDPVPGSTQVIGCDETDGQVIALYHDTRNVSRIYHMSLEKGAWNIWRDAPGFFQRFEGRLGRDGNTMEGTWERSVDGKKWEHDFDLMYSRVDP